MMPFNSNGSAKEPSLEKAVSGLERVKVRIAKWVSAWEARQSLRKRKVWVSIFFLGGLYFFYLIAVGFGLGSTKAKRIDTIEMAKIRNPL